MVPVPDLRVMSHFLKGPGSKTRERIASKKNIEIRIDFGVCIETHPPHLPDGWLAAKEEMAASIRF